MAKPILIRLMQHSDAAQIQSLEARVQPYRPEDQAAVEAMFERAKAAEGDSNRWAPIPQPGPSSEESADAGYMAFWVAAVPAEDGQEHIAGMVGIGPMSFHILPKSGAFVEALRGKERILELQHLRVDPDYQGRGIGRMLCQAVIDWARAHGCRSLYVNTTTPQMPARGLYQKLGFREVAVTFVGKYELVWMELTL